ncbi:hypothetical protein MKW98_032592 [Papaver atlanticum]|uniref:Cobalamin-independent methionine synthase MetE N-terminal domain-containing protein n=1 Tax=Papaver atlanticum TaxID=357466 RepID=A0AAD4SVR4_9MAGN|nr:hypothetical protein MKW98_032592 [Papaver atlanticum]
MHSSILQREVIAELKADGASWIQFDEPKLVMDLDAGKLNAFTDAYSRLKSIMFGLMLLDLASSPETLTALEGIVVKVVLVKETDR